MKFTLLYLILVLTFFSGCNKKDETEPRDFYVALYSVTETWKENNVIQNRPAFAMAIGKSTQVPEKVLITNFGNYGISVIVEATVNGPNMVIPQQTLTGSKSISGSGSLDNNTLTILYTETIGSTAISITATAKKK